MIESQPISEALRIIERWLPLAQQVNQLYGWQLEVTALERLIEDYHRQLSHATSPLAAQAILWVGYHQDHQGEQRDEY